MLAWIPKRLIMEKADCERETGATGLGACWLSPFDSDLVLLYTGEEPSAVFCTMHSFPRFSGPEGLYSESPYLD